MFQSLQNHNLGVCIILQVFVYKTTSKTVVNNCVLMFCTPCCGNECEI
jgi:hypothetical protein